MEANVDLTFTLSHKNGLKFCDRKGTWPESPDTETKQKRGNEFA